MALTALALNCTLKRGPQRSSTDKLLDEVLAALDEHGVAGETIRVVDHDVKPGVTSDEGGGDAWPAIRQKIIEADILVIGTPIWLGEKSSICTRVIERLYGYSGRVNEQGQWIYYGRVGGVIVTGNEDGIKHVAMNTLYSLQHLGYTIPPQADAGWIGEAGPGPSYADPGSGGVENEFTQRNTTFMTWNLMHAAAMLKRSGGIPAYGNQRREWDAGARFDHPNPEYR